MPSPPSYKKSQPGRPAGPVPDAELGHAAAVAGRIATPRRCWRSGCRWSPASRRSTSSARRSSPCASTSIRRSSRRGRSASTRSRRPITGANVNRPTGTLFGPNRNFVVQTSGQLMTAEQYRPIVVAYRNGSPVRLEEVAHVYDGVENPRNASWYNGKPAHLPRRPAPARHQHGRGRRSRQGAAARAAGAAAGVDRARHPQRPLGLDPRVGARRQVHAASSPSSSS